MATRPSDGELPIGGAGLGVDEYLEFLRKEYLADFIRRGGASVKVAVVGSDQVAERFHAGLAAAAIAEEYLFAAVDAASERVHPPSCPGGGPRPPPATGCTSSTSCSSRSPARSTGLL